jgi:hypothetical protein
MFEFSIGISEDRAEIARSVHKDLKKNTKELNVIITSYSEGEKIYIVLACEEIEKARMNFYISDAISDAISTFYKLEFIEKNLNLPINDEISLNAFKKALIAFDRDTDKYIISRNLRLEKSIYIDSFYQFRLKQLRNKWMELIKLANENASYLLCNDTFIDLLKFLIENIEISSGLVNVIKSDDGYKLCDEQFNEIDSENETLCHLNVENDNGNEIGIITSLIALSPKKINVYCNEYENSPTLTLISQIFENRVSILPTVK